MDRKERKRQKLEEDENIIMTRREFKTEQRSNIRAHIRRIAMVFGVGAIFAILLGGIFEPFFEITYFGRLFTPGKFKEFWGHDSMGTDGIIKTLNIYEDWLNMGTWLPKIGITLIYLCVILGFVFFFTYMLVDVINFAKALFGGFKEIAIGLNENVKVSYEEDNKKQNKKKDKKEEKVEDDDPFNKVLEKKEEKEKKPTTKKTKTQQEKPKKEKVEKVVVERKGRSEDDEPDLTDEELSAMLRGENISDLDAIYAGK